MRAALLAICLASLLVSGPSAPASADVLYDNLGVASSSSGAINGESPADSFSTGATGFSLQDVVLLLRDPTPSDGGSFTVDLLSDNATSPGTLVELLGTILDSGLSTSLADVTLSLATPVALAADTRYWIQLQNGSSNAPASNAFWSFDSSDSGTGVAGEYWYNTSLGVQPNTSGPYQMELGGTFVPVPEPASLALFGTGLAAIGLLRRRRWSKSPSL